MRLLEPLPEPDRQRAKQFWGICVIAAIVVSLTVAAAAGAHVIGRNWVLAGIIFTLALDLAPLVWVAEHLVRRERAARRDAREQDNSSQTEP